MSPSPETLSYQLLTHTSIIYTVTCASFVPIVYIFFPETAKRSLEEIDAIFLETKSIFDCVGAAKRVPTTSLAEMPIRREVQEKAETHVEEKQGDSEHSEVAAA